MDRVRIDDLLAAEEKSFESRPGTPHPDAVPLKKAENNASAS
jgi:hypothetical protein